MNWLLAKIAVAKGPWGIPFAFLAVGCGAGHLGLGPFMWLSLGMTVVTSAPAIKSHYERYWPKRSSGP